MMTKRKRAFVDFYLQNNSGAEAARLAGFSKKRPEKARSYASMLLNKDKDVIALLKTKRDELALQEAKDRERRLPNRLQYAEEAFERSRSVAHPPTAAKYYELGGKVLGHIQEDGANRSDQPIFKIICADLRIELGQNPTTPSGVLGEISKASELGRNTLHNTDYRDTTESPEGALTTPPPPATSDSTQQEQASEQQIVEGEKTFSEGGPAGGGTPPGPGSFININPPDNAPQILNSVNVNEKADIA